MKHGRARLVLRWGTTFESRVFFSFTGTCTRYPFLWCSRWRKFPTTSTSYCSSGDNNCNYFIYCPVLPVVLYWFADYRVVPVVTAWHGIFSHVRDSTTVIPITYRVCDTYRVAMLRCDRIDVARQSEEIRQLPALRSHSLPSARKIAISTTTCSTTCTWCLYVVQQEFSTRHSTWHYWKYNSLCIWIINAYGSRPYLLLIRLQGRHRPL